MNGSCVLLNGDYSFLGLVDWKKAMGLMFTEKVRVLKFSDRVIQGVSRSFRAPAVAVLVKVVRSVYRGRVPFSRRNVLARDRFACAYCGSRAKPITKAIPLRVRPRRTSKTGRCVRHNAPRKRGPNIINIRPRLRA